MEIGERIKQLRTRNKLTLDELASRSELTKGFLSQVERNLTTPSISTLTNIVEALGLTMAKFFQEEKYEQIVFTSEDFYIDERDGLTINWIVPNAQKNEMEPIIIEIESNQQSQVMSPFEGEEFGFVLAGKVTLIDGSNSYVLKKGDTFYLKGTHEHYFINEHAQKARLLWVCTPPNF